MHHIVFWKNLAEYITALISLHLQLWQNLEKGIYRIDIDHQKWMNPFSVTYWMYYVKGPYRITICMEPSLWGL